MGSVRLLLTVKRRPAQSRDTSTSCTTCEGEGEGCQRKGKV